ncbi:MAG: hypothetical protein HYZ65_05755 [Burkholderiales bacterium]|nr:hypothetical protein [Burkholderiales bacterium]
MQHQSTVKKIWIGRWLLAVAALHTVVAGLLFGPVLLQIVQRGVVGAVGRDPLTAAAVWFLLFGPPLALLGMAITALEKSGSFPSARGLGLGIFLFSVLGVILMPASGFWLAFPPAFGLLRIRS